MAGRDDGGPPPDFAMKLAFGLAVAVLAVAAVSLAVMLAS